MTKKEEIRGKTKTRIGNSKNTTNKIKSQDFRNKVRKNVRHNKDLPLL